MKFTEAVIAYLNGRAKTQLYGIFIFWFLLLHANIIFTSLFVNQDLIYKSTDMLKNEYIGHTYFQTGEWSFWILEFAKLWAAAGMTYLMIWLLPKTLVAKSYDQELEDHYKRRAKKIKKDLELEKQRQTLSDEQLKTTKKQEAVVEKQEDLEQKELRQWQKEYRSFVDGGLGGILKDITRSIYQHEGRIKTYFDQDRRVNQSPNIDKDTVAIADSNGLVELDTSRNRITLTPKGKYFISQTYLESEGKSL